MADPGCSHRNRGCLCHPKRSRWTEANDRQILGLHDDTLGPCLGRWTAYRELEEDPVLDLDGGAFPSTISNVFLLSVLPPPLPH